MKIAKLRTTVIVEYDCAASVVKQRCDDLTPREKAEWAAYFIRNAPETLVSANTERVRRGKTT